jgi:hypothetical protein
VSSEISGKAQLRNNFGKKIERAAQVLPATGNTTIFNVTGGRVIIVALVGEVTTVMSATATNLKLTAVGTVSTVATDLCANTAVTSLAVGNLFAPTAIGSAAQTGSAVSLNNETAVPVGIIRITTDATNTGAMKWAITYVPLDDGAFVTAA